MCESWNRHVLQRIRIFSPRNHFLSYVECQLTCDIQIRIWDSNQNIFAQLEIRIWAFGPTHQKRRRISNQNKLLNQNICRIFQNVRQHIPIFFHSNQNTVYSPNQNIIALRFTGANFNGSNTPHACLPASAWPWGGVLVLATWHEGNASMQGKSKIGCNALIIPKYFCLRC